MGQSTIQGDLLVRGVVSAERLVPTAGAVVDASVAADAAIAAAKLEHQHALQATVAGDVATAVLPCYLARAAGQVIAVEATLLAAPTGDYSLDVDLGKGNQTTPPATILTAPVVFDSGQADRQVLSASLDVGSAYEAGDVLLLSLTAAGSSGTAAADLVVVVTVREAADG